MREAGKILAQTLHILEQAVRPGISTEELDQLGDRTIRELGCTPSFLNYEGYPKSICTSVNEQVVHGIPSATKILHEGDIISLDVGVIYHGYQSDAARTCAVGEVSEEAEHLMKVTEDSFYEGLKYARAGHHLNEICCAVQKYAEKEGCGVVRDLVGHGIGSEMHEDPEIPNFDMGHKGIRLRPGMTLCIEPMLTDGGWEVDWLEDDWTVVTIDGSLASHYENTILITDGDPEILSL